MKTIEFNGQSKESLSVKQIQVLKLAFLELFHESVKEIFVQHLESAKASPDSLLFKMTLTRAKVLLTLNPNTNQTIDFEYDLNLGKLMVNASLVDAPAINEFVTIVRDIMALIAANQTIYKIK